MGKTDYAVLMNRKILEAGIYYYSPEVLIEGELLEEEGEQYFVDTLGNEYMTIHNCEMTFSDEERGVGYVISKEQLLAKYKESSLEEAKSLYYDSICDNSHFGFFIYHKNIIGVVPMKLRNIFEKLNNMDIPDGNVIQVPMSEFKQPEYEENGIPLSENEIKEQIECVFMTMELFEDILSSKTYEEVMNKLRQISPKQENILENKNGQQILELFDQCYDSFLEIESIEEIKAIIKKLEDYYIELIVKMDTLAKTKSTENASKTIYGLVDTYDNLLKINDLEQIRKGILSIKENSRKNLERITKNYDASVQYENIFDPKNQVEELPQEKEAADEVINVKEVKDYFDQVIIGQDEAKKDVIAAIVMNKLSNDPRNKNSCLLVGPTGSGKTLIAETVSKYFKMPMEIVDTTQLTMPGYVGANIEDFLVRLLNKAGGGG